MDLANQIFGLLVLAGSSDNSLQVDTATVAKRMKAAANLLAKATDGILADGEKRVIFNDENNMDAQALGANEIPEWMLTVFSEIGHQSDDSEVKQLLLKKLKSLQMRVQELPNLGNSTAQTRRTLEDLVTLYKRDPAKLPNNSSIRDRN